ncbi:LacI family DNA-binding transcriptional regulator [Devosia sp.]|uniref:LacI family DNA-binding transcriptional regulator n=1 Tax=Devosia sp. TaxID=1871048 RepID=UPI001B2ADFCE|nr:LacI family DNA-binding transcriptional regulator [Devosia sp.]MBO9591020.1 LacI family DNA-binding transcriptional regulator [Devosia sp.]
MAKLAGVSSATISRAFTADSLIKPETRARILALADEHGYRPNAMARSLNMSQSRLVALVVNTVANPAEGEGLDQLVHRLQARERMPLLLCCANHEDRNQLMRIASAYRVDHVVLYSDAVSIDDAADIFRSATLIVASSEPLQGRAVSDVRLDASAATRQVVDRLVDMGRRHFVYLSGRSSSHIDKQRMSWFSDALEAQGLAFDVVEHGDYSYESGYKEAVLLLRRARPDVIVCANDLMAIGVKDAASLLNIRVPEDLAIVGHDGVALANWEAHSITTIMPLEGMVSTALAEIIDRDPTEPPMQRVVDCVVRWGRSTPELPR